MIAIRDGKVIAASTPQKLFENTESKYLAYLFDDVNEVFINGKQELIYPHQIAITNESGLKAKVLNSYYRGSYWLIEVNMEDQIIFLNHHKCLENSLTVCLQILS